MSATNGYTTVKQLKRRGGSSDGTKGRRRIWLEVKVSSDVDLKAMNPNINQRIGKGIIGKINRKLATNFR